MTFAARPLFTSATPSAAIVDAYDGAHMVCRRITIGGCTGNLFFNTDGTVSVTTSAGAHHAGDTGLPSHWYNPTTPSIGNSYWVRATHVSGDVVTAGDSVGSWLALSSNRFWGMHAANGASAEGTYTFEIASDSGGVTVVATGNIILTAIAEGGV